MTVLDTLYVSGGQDALIITLEFDDGVNNFCLLEGFVPLTLTLEDARVIEFQPMAMQVAQPAKNADGTQDLAIALANVDGLVSTALRESIAAGRQSTATFRVFMSSDLSGPAEPPLKLSIKSGDWTPMQVNMMAGYMNILDTAWPRWLFNLNQHPGLRYIS